ncbi:hypothetical protein LCGC14_0960410 [marine sediment metagenome]|uniref:Uncharacterized protein n=1 Tax=marine sediment metagenome TaxID=412755 RepID=A0A0F9P0T2_9ZZZZ
MSESSDAAIRAYDALYAKCWHEPATKDQICGIIDFETGLPEKIKALADLGVQTEKQSAIVEELVEAGSELLEALDRNNRPQIIRTLTKLEIAIAKGVKC